MKIKIEPQEKFIMDYRLKIGNSIRDLREKKGYSQNELADIMNLTRSTISKIEQGKFSFNIDYLSKFSLFLDFEFHLKESNNNKEANKI